MGYTDSCWGGGDFSWFGWEVTVLGYEACAVIRSRSLLILVVFLAIWASPVAQAVRNLPEMQETQVQPVSQEDALEKEWHPLQCSCLESPMDGGAWRIPWMEEPGGLQSRGLQRVRHDWATFTFTVYTAFLFLVYFRVYISSLPSVSVNNLISLQYVSFQH